MMLSMMLIGAAEGVREAPRPEEGAPLHTAKARATTRVPLSRPDQTAGEIRAALAGETFDCVDDIAVLEGGRLVGIVPMETLLAAPPDAEMARIMDSDPPAVEAGTDAEDVVWSMVGKGESSVAVVNGDGQFAGLVPPHRMLAVLLEAHDEDVARLGGYLASTSDARQAAEERVAQRLWHRLPWLLVGLLGAMASAVIVGAFEHQLEQQVLLAIFIPAVVYMADAVGTQTEAVLIRGLSVGVDVGRVARRELASGAAIGLTISLAFFPFALGVWGDGAVALAVALALFASCSIATLVAMLLPLLFHRLDRDPAFGSGPLATVLQDLLSIVVYFAVAIPIAG
jgi:magnesium transporter